MNKKNILFCGNGLSCEIIKTLKNDYHVFMISEFDTDHGIEYVDKLVKANSKDPEESLKVAIDLYNQGFIFDAVLSLCWDCSQSVAKIAEHFNLFSVPYETTIKASVKSVRSQIFKENNVPSPRYETCNTYNDFLKKVDVLGLPIVLKPINLSSSKGVILVSDKSELEKAYSYSKSFSNNEDLIINEYVEGTEYSTEGLMIKDKFFLTGISERVFRYKEFAPFFVEVGDIMPVTLSEHEIDLFAKVTERAALSLGINNGVVKGDLIYTKFKEIKVFEITPRLGGPRFGTEMVPLSNGTNILRAAIQQALGENINQEYLSAKFTKGMVNRSVFPKRGRIVKIDGLEEIKKMPGYYDFKWWHVNQNIGDIIGSPENMCGGVGYIIATGDNRDEAIMNADKIENRIAIITE